MTRPGRETEARRWCLQARHGLQAARWNLEGGFFDTACFLCQQSAEKALKSLLYALGKRRRAFLTHSAVEMVRMVGKEIARIQELEPAALELDLHYIPSRYPNGLPSGYPHIFYGRETAERALRHAEHLFEAVVAHYRERGDTAIFSEEDEGPGQGYDC